MAFPRPFAMCAARFLICFIPHPPPTSPYWCSDLKGSHPSTPFSLLFSFAADIVQNNIRWTFKKKKKNEDSVCVEKKNQLDATEWFIALIIRSTCFGHFYAHRQELETIYVLLPRMVCSAWLLVVGGQVQSSRLCVQEERCCTTRVVQHPSSWTHRLLPCTWPPTTSNQGIVHHRR